MELHLFVVSSDAALGALAVSAANGLPISLQTAQSLTQAQSLLSPDDAHVPWVLLIDLRVGDYLRTRQWVQQHAPDARAFFIAPEKGSDVPRQGGMPGSLAAGLFESGEVISRPRQPRELTGFFARLLGEAASLGQSQEEGVAGLDALIGRSMAFRGTIEKASVAASTGGPILLTGEGGSGKGYFARAIHTESGGDPERFIELDCRVLPEDAFADYAAGERHASEGAGGRRQSLLRRAEGGTLYLEDVSALDRTQQTQLVALIDTSKLASVHGPQGQRRGIRLIAGTRYDLALSSRTGAFDRELYRRLAEGEIKIPPLRERPSDILLLAEHFLNRLADRRPGTRPRLTPEAKEILVSYRWPGNVRELLGVLQIALLKANGAGKLDVEHFAECLLSPPSQAQASTARPPGTRTVTASSASAPPPSTVGTPVDSSLHFIDGRVAIELPPGGIAFDDFEKALLRAALARTRGNVLRAAKLLRLGRGSLRYRLEKHGIVQPRRRRSTRRRISGKGGADLATPEPLSRAS